MVQNPPEGYQRVIPYVLYEDASAAIEFVCNAFGFSERMRMPGEDGKLMHAEIERDGNVVMLATAMSEMGQSSARHQSGYSSMVLCYVDDVDAHYEQASEAGAEILAEPADQFYGDRTYAAFDLEGHRWYFHQHVKDVAPEEMNPSVGAAAD